MRVARWGLHVSCWLDPPCKVKSNRFAVSRGYESLDHIIVKGVNEIGMKMFVGVLLAV